MSLPPVINYIDFEILNEPWNRYKLSDNTTLYTRVIVTNVIKTGQYDPLGKPIYNILSTIIHTVRAPKELRGEPTNVTLTPQQLADSIVEEVNAKPIYEDWNVYRLEDGTTLKIKPMLVSIHRTSKYDPLGEPIYLINVQNIVKDEVPKVLWKKQT